MSIKNSIKNAELKVMLAERGIIDTINSIDIEKVKDFTARIILRTLMSSIEALDEHLAAENTKPTPEVA